ncbi:MAG TPA: hypothetical protein VLA16_21325 [Ideonella sp.]|nr:hypothetical protein [Ideonella sp.]
MLATTLATTLAASMAIVTQDQASLRASPRDSAQQQAVLWQGDVLEIRGERMDYLQVYDHRRERAGYVLAAQVRTTSALPTEAPELLSVLRFVRDTPGAEALGIAYAAAYLKAVPAGAMTAEPFDALGTLADRLARRASSRQGKANDATLAAHLEGVAPYGVKMFSYERDGAMQICYDGDAFRRVLAMPSASAEQRARAALGLTRHECIDPALQPLARFQFDQWRAEVLDRVETGTLPQTLKNRLRLRQAGVWAALAYAQTRRPDASAAEVQGAGERAVQALAAIDKAELSDADLLDYSQAAMRAGASRWAAEPPLKPAGRLALVTQLGAPGETCVLLTDTQHGAARPLLRRCTYATVWPASASVSPDGQALALAVQPLATWRELWIFRRDAQAEAGWVVDVLPPAASGPELGYAEFAGWVPGGERFLLVRESRVEGRSQRSFEVVRRDTLATEKQASRPELLVLFGRWQDPVWKRLSLSLR